MKTHFEIFDKMLEEVQQLRLDANYFAKSTSRIDTRINKMKMRCRRYEKRFMRRSSERRMKKVVKCHGIIKGLLKGVNDNIVVFKDVVHELKRKCEYLCSRAETPFNLTEPSITNINCVVNAGEIVDDGILYCKCNRPGFGNMIACDFVGCKTGWFHCECVNATGSLKVPWVCSDCKKKTVSST